MRHKEIGQEKEQKKMDEGKEVRAVRVRVETIFEDGETTTSTTEGTGAWVNVFDAEEVRGGLYGGISMARLVMAMMLLEATDEEMAMGVQTVLRMPQKVKAMILAEYTKLDAMAQKEGMR